MNKREAVLMNFKKWVPLTLFYVIIISSCVCPTTHVKKEKPAPQMIKDITPKEALALIQGNKGNPNFIIIDVRTPEEYRTEHIKGAINIDYYSEAFKTKIANLDKTKTYLIYCRTGHRSGITLKMMQELGFRRVYNMIGGIIQWKEEGYPTESSEKELKE